VATNLTGRRLRVFIGADEQDWSLAAGVFSVGRDRLVEGQPLQISATLEILPTGGPESIDPQDNPVRWRPGQPVRVEVVDDGGNWVAHPQGRLYLLEEPEFPQQGQGISLSLGCRLSWHNTYEFDDDKTGVVVGEATNSAVVAQRLLEANEVPTAAIGLGSWPYAVSIPAGKGENRSFIQQAAGLAYSNDWRFLYQDGAGVVVDAALDLSIAAPVVTIVLGSNDVLYQGVKVEATPPEVCKVAGLGTVTAAATQPIVEVAEVEGDRSQFAVGNVSCPGVGVISRSTTTTTWFESLDGTRLTFRTVTSLEAPRSAVAKDPGQTGGFPCDMIDWKETTVDKRFDLTAGGRLIEITTTEQQRRFTFTTAVLPRLNFATTRVSTETPSYGPDEAITQIVLDERQALGILDPNSADPLALIDTRRVTTRWTQQGNETWTKSVSERIPRALTNSSPESDPTAAVGKATTSTSGTGQNQPPRAEIWDGGVITNDQEFQATATYTLPGGGSDRTRKRLYEVPWGFSETQCSAIAAAHIGLIAGRHRAALIEFPINDALLGAGPLFPCDVIFPDGSKRHYRIDSLSWEHSQTVAKAVGVGILVGTTAAPTQAVPSPLPVPLTGS